MAWGISVGYTRWHSALGLSAVQEITVAQTVQVIDQQPVELIMYRQTGGVDRRTGQGDELGTEHMWVNGMGGLQPPNRIKNHPKCQPGEF